MYDDAVRDRLLRAASTAVSASGPDAVSLREVAREAGTTTAAVYSLFGSREALVDAVVAEGLRRFGAHLDAVPATDDPAADLLALGLAYRRSALAEPEFYRAMFPSSGPGRDARVEPTFRRLRAAVQRLADSGADLGDTDEVALRLWALVHGLVGLELGGHLPGDLAERERRYEAALRASG